MTGRRRVFLTVFGVLVLLATGAFSLSAAPSKPDFALAVSPSSQSVTQGSSVTYSVTISRQGGFANAVALSVSGSTSGLTISFSPASPVSGSTTQMTVAASGAAPVGNRSLTLTGTGGGLTRSASFSVNVQPVAQPGFNLAVTPSAQTISQDDSTSFNVAITRLNGFAGAVSLSVAGLPKKTTGTFSPLSIPAAGTTSTLAIVSDKNADVGTFTLTVTASGGSPLVTRTASETLTVDKKQTFLIAGDASTTLYPGTASDVDLTLTNPNSFTIRVTQLSVSVEEHTSKPGCSGTQNFTTGGLVGTIDVPGNTTQKLSQLGVTQPHLPKITFLDNPVDQDACKSATVTMQYSGTAVKP
jgi:hypothetical protein